MWWRLRNHGNVASNNVASKCGVRHKCGGASEIMEMWRQTMWRQNVASGTNVVAVRNVASNNAASKCGVRHKCGGSPKCGVKQCGVKMWRQTLPLPNCLPRNVSSKKVFSGRHKSTTLNACALLIYIYIYLYKYKKCKYKCIFIYIYTCGGEQPAIKTTWNFQNLGGQPTISPQICKFIIFKKGIYLNKKTSWKFQDLGDNPQLAQTCSKPSLWRLYRCIYIHFTEPNPRRTVVLQRKHWPSRSCRELAMLVV